MPVSANDVGLIVRVVAGGVMAKVTGMETGVAPTALKIMVVL